MIREKRNASTDCYTERYAARMAEVPDLSPEDEREKIARWQQHGDTKARDEVIFANMKVAVAVARQHRNFGLPMDELIALGSHGILKALEKYELDRKSENGKRVRFASYAWHWIRAKITRAECRQWHMVSGQATSSRRLFSLIKAMSRGNALFGPDRQAVYSYVADQLHIPQHTAKQWMTLISHRALSLDSTMAYEDGDVCMKDQLVSDVYQPVDQQFANTEAQRLIQRKLREMELTPRQMKILKRRMLRDDPESLEVIAREEGVTRERVRQVECILRDKIRRFLRDEAEDLGIDTAAYMEQMLLAKGSCVSVAASAA
jgi:RNA polymerase sigma factor (sigma-70 family)